MILERGESLRERERERLKRKLRILRILYKKERRRVHAAPLGRLQVRCGQGYKGALSHRFLKGGECSGGHKYVRILDLACSHTPFILLVAFNLFFNITSCFSFLSFLISFLLG